MTFTPIWILLKNSVNKSSIAKLRAELVDIKVTGMVLGVTVTEKILETICSLKKKCNSEVWDLQGPGVDQWS